MSGDPKLLHIAVTEQLTCALISSWLDYLDSLYTEWWRGVSSAAVTAEMIPKKLLLN